MPAYFFHLKLELYQSPATSSTRRGSNTKHPTASYLPPPGTDIFRSGLPAHRTSKWSSYTFGKRPESCEGEWYSGSGSEKDHSPKQLPRSERSEIHGAALLLPERSSNLNQSHRSASPALTPARLSNEASAKDWRYDRVAIESIDMESHMPASPTAVAEKSRAATSGKSGVSSGLHTKAAYLPADPRTTDVGWGVVHLYRDMEESAALDGNAHPRGRAANGTPNHAANPTNKDDAFDPDVCTTLCILAVPSYMLPSDLLGFVGDQAREDVSHFRLIRTGRANKYMVLMKFRQARKAREWQKAWNGRLFSAMEPENCHVVFVKSVEFLTPDNGEVGQEDDARFPHNTNDPFTPVSRNGRLVHGNIDASGRPPSKSISSKPLAPPTPNLLELPTCPVCLERMDETTGLLTILCQHVFHCACLEKWRGSGCPVCRYTQTPSFTFPYPRPTGEQAEEPEPMCGVCASVSNLWICLICGAVGCGRYDSAHAYAHYEATSHCYAMDVATQHVWDYAGDGYVHRLIQSKPDSKLIDLPDSRQRHANEAFRVEGDDVVPREKMEAMANEYTYLLTSQLEGQRRYFEEQLERAVDKASQASANAEDAARRAEAAIVGLGTARTERERSADSLARLEKSLERSEQAKAKFEALARNLSTQLRAEKTMNEGLLKRIHAAEEKAKTAQEQADSARAEMLELRDMNHDLQMFISTAEKVKELQAQGEEVESGTAVVGEGKRKGKGRKK